MAALFTRVRLVAGDGVGEVNRPESVRLCALWAIVFAAYGHALPVLDDPLHELNSRKLSFSEYGVDSSAQACYNPITRGSGSEKQGCAKIDA